MNKMGVNIYNPADLEAIQKWRDLANAEVGQTAESLDTIQNSAAVMEEAIATIYEDSLTHGEKIDEVLATIYEAVLDVGGTL